MVINMNSARFFDGLFGNEQLITYLSSAIDEGNLPHALILEGVSGSGKTTVALSVCAALEPEYADKIKRLQSPDVTVHTAEEGKKTVGIAVIRDLKSKAFIKPQELSVRVFIIDEASTMTTEAQNALLKILEEPPKNVYFLLLCDNASALLPTVRSRAPVLRMSVFDDDSLSQYLISSSPKARIMSEKNPDAFRMLIRSAEGAIGAAEARLGSKNTSAEKLREKTDRLLDLLIAAKTADILLFFISSGFARDELDILILNLECAIRDMLKCKYGAPKSLTYFFKADDAEALSAEFAKSTLISLFDCAEKIRTYLTVNVNASNFCVRAADMLSDAIKH
ncbi:MAG: AAA family ATPase [Clostridia bacterium]|nr:AAA family ATPase [Clostridia bacterium]